jgi:hypothetical protein
MPEMAGHSARPLPPDYVPSAAELRPACRRTAFHLPPDYVWAGGSCRRTTSRPRVVRDTAAGLRYRKQLEFLASRAQQPPDYGALPPDYGEQLVSGGGAGTPSGARQRSPRRRATTPGAAAAS